MISIYDLPAMWEPVAAPATAAIATALSVAAVPGADGILIWTATQNVRVKVLPKSSSAVATTTTGILISTTDGIRFIPVFNAKLSIIEVAATAAWEYQFIRFLQHKNN